MSRSAPLALSLVATLAIALAACGGDDDDDSVSAPATLATSELADAGEVVVDANGAAVYAADQEASGEILCVGRCESIWRPVTVAVDQEPTGEDVPGELGILERPGGAEQVTLDGAPVYTFAEDGPGEVTGDGFSDTFGSQRFTWHVIRGEGEGEGESEPSSGGGYGGY